MFNLLLLLFIIVLMGIAIRFKISVAISIFFASIIIAVFKNVFLSFPKLMLETLTHLDTINMILVIIIVTYLAEILKVSGFLDEITYTFKRIFPPKVYLPLFTMTIGLLPMPGGALVSAPMVGDGAKDLDLEDSDKALINFWFRHVWEPISPLYPEFLLGVSILAVNVIQVIKVQWIVSFGMLFAGIVALIPKIKNNSNHLEKPNLKIILSILKTLSPIILIFFILLTFKTLPSFVAMLVGLIYIILLKHVSFESLKKSFNYKKIIEYAFLIYSIFLLREIINSTKFAISIYSELKQVGAPNFLVLFFLPFSIGFLAGISSASIGIAYPLLMPLLKQNGVLVYSNLLIAYLGVWTALLFTPTHLCLSLSVDYFKATFSSFYKKMIVPFLILLTLSSIWYFVLLK